VLSAIYLEHNVAVIKTLRESLQLKKCCSSIQSNLQLAIQGVNTFIGLWRIDGKFVMVYRVKEFPGPKVPISGIFFLLHN